MTMPKFDPVAHMQVSVEEGVGTYFPRLHKPEKYNADWWRFDPLHSANQLTEAYEAGKRDAIPQWQPIETAPKDVFLLLYCPRIGIVHGHWNADKHSKKPSPYWTHDRERLYGIRETRYDQPTHWMPLPAAPKGEE